MSPRAFPAPHRTRYNNAVYPYDASLLATVQSVPQSVAEVLEMLQTIEATCIDGDGLKWFNWLYLQVTQAVEARVASAGFADPAWLAELDVQSPACILPR